MSEIFFVLVVIGIPVLVIQHFTRKSNNAYENKCYYFSNLQFSAQDFYGMLEENIKAKQMPDVGIGRVTYSQRNFLSNKREYLRIQRKGDIFDICAAPFGTGFFVSYWLGEPQSQLKSVLDRTPLFSPDWQGSTFYQVDTANMFKSTVKNSLLEVMESFTQTKGIRGLSESERLDLNS